MNKQGTNTIMISIGEGLYASYNHNQCTACTYEETSSIHLADCQSWDDKVLGVGTLTGKENRVVQRIAQRNSHLNSPMHMYMHVQCTCTYTENAQRQLMRGLQHTA